ncbi:MAG: cell filamentation protein Fic, partial [Ignavibacteria bacterium]
TLPAEIDELQKHDAMMAWLEERFEMPDNTATLLIGFLRQGEGTLSKRAREKEFAFLESRDVTKIETTYRTIVREATEG